MQIVIDISEDSYKATCNGRMLPPDVENVVQGIKNGTPLPKGHGTLIDSDKLIGKWEKATVRGRTEFDQVIKCEPTVIPAESEAKLPGWLPQYEGEYGYFVGQIVRCGGLKYEIEAVSDEPFIIFDDGTKHYQLLLKRCNGGWNERLSVNDAQLE